MEGFPIGFVVLLFVFCSRSLAGEELQYTTLGQLAFGCPQGWKAFETNCYFLADFKMEFEDAEETCENLGTMSLKIDDDIENKKIAEFARNVSWTRFWNGQKYSDSTKCDGIWGNNQPPEGTQDGACVSVGENGLWKVTSCKELLPFVCKKPACINGTSDCGNGKCINTKWFCDGINDCSNNLDEMNCANRCSFYKTGASGTITQGSYKPNADCFWTIEGPVGTQLKLTFTRVRTEKDRDIIEVWGGSKSLKSSTKLTTLSGDSDNRDVYSFNNFLIIRFRSDATVESSGFVATWRSDVAELSRTVQDIAASDNWQSLSSPFYPSTPPYGFSRHWLITTEADSILTLEILEVDLNSDWELLIYDGDSYMEQPVTIKMSSDLRSPPIYISSSNKIRVVLKGIKIMSGKGINMRVKKGCDVQIQKNAGEIYSPGYLKTKYPTSIDCSWTLKAPDVDKRPILLNLVEFSLAADDKDVVKVYNGSDTSSPAIHEGDGFKGDLNGAMKSVAGGDTIHLTFTSSLIQADGRFKIEFSIGCPSIPPSANMSLSSDSKTYGSEVTVTCDEGYSFVQEEFYLKPSLLMSCLKGGKWNTTRYPACQIIYCGVPEAIANGFIANNESKPVTYGSKTTYKCYPGFQMEGSATVTCRDTGKWSTPPTCKTSLCSAADEVTHAVKKTVTGDGTSAGSIVNYTCNSGYELKGPLQILCQSNTTWSHPAPTCTKIMCPSPSIMNGDLSPKQPVMFEDTVTLTCKAGFMITNETTNTASLQCQASGKLEELSCEDKNECDTGVDNCLQSQNCINTIGSFQCVCKEGYKDSNCIDINECSKDKGGCSHTCENTVPFYNCKCNNGYVLFTENGTMNRFIADGETGLRQGDVYHINHTCVPVTCQRPNDVANGVIHSNRSVFYFGETIDFSCSLGWKLNGTSSLTCAADRNWNSSQPVCEAISCPMLMKTGTVVEKARVQRIVPDTDVGFGDEVNVECLLENGSLMNKTLYCEYDNQNKSYSLQGDSPICPVVDCDQPEKIPGMKTPTVTGTTVNSSFTFECTEGATKSGLSSDGSQSTVTCQPNGRWGFGNLTCKAARCTDPGTPGGGTQIVDGYEGGQSVSYNCTRMGYTPDPPGELFCIISSSGAANWNGTMPRCKDTTPPQFTNCPTSNISIDSLDVPGFAVPDAQDNSGLVVSISVTPQNFDPWKPVRGATTVTYTATDGEGNTADCVIQIILKNREFPNLTCPDSLKLSINDTVSREVNLTQYITSNSPLSNIPSETVSFSTYGQTKNYRVSSTNDMGMTSSCAFQVEIAATKCFEQIQNSLTNADVNHTRNADGTVTSTTVTCKSGFAFSDGNTSLQYQCTGENMWTPALPLIDCIEYKESIYTFVINVVYGSKQILNDACVSEHNNLVQQVVAADNTLGDLCRKAFRVYYSFNVSSIQTSNTFYKLNSTLVLEVLDFDGDTGNMATCAEDIDKYYQNIFKYTTHTSCGSINASGGEGFLKKGSSCDTRFQLVTVSGSPKCLPCSPGTYFSNEACVPCADGTYQDTAGATFCKSCPDNKASLTPRISEDQCIDRCIDGFFSSNGLPPCTACPVDTYWKNSTFCEPCPNDGSTLHNEASKTVSACKAACAPGSYSITGYEPCSKCPKNFHATSSTDKKQTTCTECSSGSFTVGDGNTDSVACNSTSLCTGCSGHGTCQMVNHEPYCTCNAGFTGSNCSQAIDFCSSSPCENGGVCKSESSGFTCTCQAATDCVTSEDGNFFAGTQSLETPSTAVDITACKEKCQNINDCKAAAFHNVNKLCVIYNEAQVTSGKTANSDYTWLSKTCTHNFYFNGTYCERDLRNDCTNTSCSEQDMCMDLINNYQCVCPKSGGYSGPRCEKDSDLCKDNSCTHGRCLAFGDVRYQCVCDAGFTGASCETNINECDMNPNACLYGSVCADGVDKYTCDCPSGFSGENCQVEKVFCGNGVCTNGLCLDDYDVNKAVCICEDPYEIDTASGLCKLVDHCSPDRCTTNHTVDCSNSLEGFTCRCKEGFDGSLCQHNTDDCASNPCGNGTCTDDLESYSCTCEDGWEGDNCNINTDDCQNQCSEDHSYNCTDLLQDYMCNCKPGYTGKNCTDEIDECQLLPCEHGGNCTDRVADFTCRCPDGWEGKTCADPYNYCNDTICDNNGACYSLKDTFYCSCEAGTQGTRCETSPPVCDRISPCTDKGKCDESGGTANCTCEKNYTGVSCQLIKDSCSADPCNPGGSCKTQTVGYRCECMDGYQGDDCKVESPLCGSGACSSGQSCEQEGRVEYCLCPAKQVSVGSACKDGSLDFDLWFDKGMVSVDVLSGQPFKLNSAGNMTVMFWIGLLTDVSSGTVFKIKNDMDSTTFLEVKTNNVSFKGNEIAMTVSAGKWNHIAVTWQSDGKYELIINGIKENGDTTPPAFQEKLVRLVFDSQFTGYVSQLTVWRDILLYTKILEAINNPQYLPSFDLALGWYDYSLTKSTWRLTPSRAMADGKLCDAQRIMDSTCDNKMDKLAPSADNCPESAIHKISPSRTVQVRNVVQPAITFGGQEPITDNLKGDLLTWGAYQLVYAATDEAGNIGECRFKLYVKKQDCNAANVYSTPTLCETTKAVQGFCPTDKKPAMPWPNIINCGVLGSYNRLDPFQMPVEPTCGATRSQKFTVTLEIKYKMLLPCTTTKVDLLKNVVQSAFQTLGSLWSGLTDNLAVSGNCSQSASKEVFIKAEFSKLLSTINSLPPIEIIKRAVIEDNILEGTAFSNIASAKLQKNEVVFDQFASCDTEAYVIVGNDCVQCGPGSFFNATLKQCVLCPVGSYNPTPGRLDSCDQCTAPKTTLRRGSDASTDCVANCPVGQYLNNSVCTDCPKDYYQNEEGKDYCRPCPLGKITKNPKTDSKDKCFDDCPSGTELNEDGNCTNCQQGYYRTQTVQDVCTKCPTGNTTREKKSKSEADCYLPDCQSGNFINATDNNTCHMCPIGQYQPVKWQFECMRCNENYTTKSEGSTSVNNCTFYCPEGYEVESAQNEKCRICPRGTYRQNKGNERFSPCQNCTQNTTDGPGSKSMADCSISICTAGQKITNNQCDDCPVDTYQNVTLPDSNTRCMNCTDGFGTMTTKSTAETNCTFYCVEGYEVESAQNKKCRICPRGTYRQNKGNERFSPCQNCTQNTTDGPGSKSMADCSIPICTAGQKITNHQCADCPVDTYQNVSLPDSNTRCMNCTEGFGTMTTKSMNKDECKPVCPEGKQYNKTSTSCVPCPQGYWKNDSMRFDQCVMCRENYTTPGEGSTNPDNCSIRDCAPGTKISGGNCEPCPFGEYQDKPRQTVCEECGTNLNTSKTGASSIDDCTVSCAPGLEGPNGSCVACKDDTVKPYNGNGQCEPCTENRTSNANHTSCTGEVFCAVGAEYVSSTTDCSLCAIGFFKNMRGNTPCKTCPGNYTTASVGTAFMTDCSKLHCVPGFYGSSDSCIPCDFGFYKSVNGTDNCTKCDESLTTSSKASTAKSDCSVVVCDAGSYRTQSNQCQLCPKGKYQPVRGMDSCESCPNDNYTTENQGSTHEDQCLKVCEKGHYRNQDNKCSICGLGFYQPSEGQAACINCSSEHPYTTANTGSTSVEQCLRVCDKGSYRPSTNRNGCIKCEIGKYQPDNGKTSCISCGDAANVTTLQTGSLSSESCMPICPAGKYLDTIKRACEPCELGKYNNKTGTQQECDDCTDRKTTASTGATSKDLCSLDDCQAGFYRENGGKGCSECERNTYQNETSQSSCKPCPDSKVTLITGAKSIQRCVLDCPSGEEYNGLVDNGSCVKCKIGEYRLKEKSDKCLVCPEGQTTISKGASKCVDSKVSPKRNVRVNIRLKLRFQVTNCGNPGQVKGVLESFILRITIRICRSWNEKCDLDRVTFMSASWCPIGRRRKRAPNDLEAIVDVVDVPEVLTNGTDRRSAVGVFADAFGVDAQPDTVELENNGISFDGVLNLTSRVTCARGSVLVNNTECEKCKAGTKFVDVNNSCVDCSTEGKYQNATGQSVCLSCPGIMTPSADATHCISKCEAESDYCQNGGTCTVKSESEVSCSCPSPYTGPLCEMRSDPSKDSQLNDILGAAIGGGGAFLLVLLIVIGCVVMRRRKDKKQYMKSMQSYTSEPAPFMSAMEHAPYLAHKSHHLNPLYDNRDVMDFYDPMGSGMFDRPYNAVTPKEDYDQTDEPYPSVYRPIVGSTSPRRQGTSMYQA